MIDGWSPEAAERLRLAVSSVGLQAGVAERTGIPVPTLQRILANKVDPGVDRLLKLVQVAGVSLDYILWGDAERQASRERAMPAANLALVPLHDVVVSAGFGVDAVEHGEAPENLGFPPAWLRRHFGDATKLRVVHVQGDSMVPALADGDLVMINVDRRDPVDGIFVLRMDDQLLVKRVFFPSARRILVTSDNKDYDRQDRMLDLENEAQRSAFNLIGRVVWVGKAL